MKITQLIVVLLAVTFAGAGVKYSLDQQKVMNLLTKTHGNGELIKEGGLLEAQENYRKKVNKAAIERKTENEASEKARLLKNDASDKRAAAAEALASSQEQLAQTKVRLEAADASVAKIKAQYETSMASVTEDLKDELPELADADINTYVQAINDYVASTQETIEKCKKDTEAQEVLMEEAAVRIAKLNSDIARVKEIQAKFASDYKKNDSEYVVATVDPHWNFVVFFAEPSDGLLPGDTVPLLSREGGEAIATLEIESVKGNVVIAKYDKESLTTGRAIVPGDRLFRKKPLGH